jgi:hypothetical protein
MSKDKQYSDTLQRILQGGKFKATTGINGVIHTYQLEETAFSLWLCKYKPQGEREMTYWSVDKIKTNGTTLVLETSILGKRAEVRIDVSTDVQIISE